MSRRSIDTHFWNDSYTGELHPDFKLLFLYLITSPLSNMLGCYEIQFRRIAFDTGLSNERLQEGFERFRQDKKADYVDGYVILCNFVTNQSYNSNMLKSAVDEIDGLPDTVLSSLFFKRLMEGLRKVNQRFDKGKLTLPNIEVEYEYELEEESEGEPDTGTPPREEEKPKLHPDSDIPDKEVWSEYLLAKLRYSKEFVEHLWDHLQVKGWSVGSPPEPVKDWRAYARKQNQWAYEYSQKQKKLESNTQTNGKANSHQQNSNSRYSGHGK